MPAEAEKRERCVRRDDSVFMSLGLWVGGFFDVLIFGLGIEFWKVNFGIEEVNVDACTDQVRTGCGFEGET